MSNSNTATVFDYRALRLLVGIIALSLPFLVSVLASDPLSSISWSYHTEARDAFVGSLFIVGAFLWAYNGHAITGAYLNEANLSKLASISAFVIALFATSWDPTKPDLEAYIHSFATGILFVILAYFCFVSFRKVTEEPGVKKNRRNKIYFLCGLLIVASMVVMVLTKTDVFKAIAAEYRVTYWAEFVALVSFGFAWIVAGKAIPYLVDEAERYDPFNDVFNLNSNDLSSK